MIRRDRQESSSGVPPWKSPLALSVLLHLAIVLVAATGWSWFTPRHEPPPRSIAARLIAPQDQPSPVVDTQDQPDADELKRAEQERQRLEEERRKAEQARRQAEEKAREEQRREAEEERRKQEALAREQEARAREEARRKAEAEAREQARQKAEAERRRQEAARKKAEEERRKAEQERLAREEAERREAERQRLEAERKLREQQLQALAEEARRAEEAEALRRQQAAAAKAREAQMLSETEKYQALIRERLTRAWYPPSSATEEMTARLQITLLPTGELAGVKLVASSGNTAFDNSTLSAVRSLDRYPVPDDRETFERYFRQFTIEFNPRRLK